MPSSSHVQGDVIDVTCGPLKGKLYKNKFYCPGIHRECIEQQDGKFVSPKMFTIMGEKERLKDWKNAVRINGLQLRRYIDSGQLDFYRHDEYCTGRCVARTPITYSNGEKPVTQSGNPSVNRRRTLNAPSSSAIPGDFPVEKKLIRSPVPKVEFVGSINEHTYCHLPDDSERLGEQDVKPDLSMLQNFLQRKTESFKKVVPVESSNSNAPEMIKFPIELLPIDGTDSSFVEDKNFWTGIMEFGLLDVFLADIKEHISILRRDLVTSSLPEDCHKLSVIVRALGLMDKFKKKMSTYKHNMEKQEAKLEREMEALKSQVAIFERRKEALKRKSEKFKNLLQISTTKNETHVVIEKPVYCDEQMTSVVGNAVSILVRPDDRPMQAVNVKTEEDKSETIRISPSSTSKNKSFVKKVLLTSIPSDQKNDLKQVTVTIERLKQCLEKNKKVCTQSATQGAGLLNTEGSASSITEKSVYIPMQVSSSEDGSEMGLEAVDKTSGINEVASAVVTSTATSDSVSAPSKDVLKTDELGSCVTTDDGEDTIEGRPRAKRLRLSSKLQKTNSAVIDKLRDKLKLNQTDSESEDESSKELAAAKTDANSDNMGDEVKKLDAGIPEEKPDPNTGECGDQVMATPFYGHKQKTVTEIIVSKEVAEKAKHILRGAKEPLPDNGRKSDTKTEKLLVNKVEQKEKSEDVDETSDDADVGAKTEMSCQTPLDGIREKAVDSHKSVVASRRSARKTPHLFTWGSKIDIVKKVL